MITQGPHGGGSKNYVVPGLPESIDVDLKGVDDRLNALWLRLLRFELVEQLGGSDSRLFGVDPGICVKRSRACFARKKSRAEI